VLHGKRVLVTGIATTGSIAHATARRCLELGAEVVISAHPRELPKVKELARDLDPTIDVLGIDLADPDSLEEATQRLRREVGVLHGALHAVAFAPRGVLSGAFVDAAPHEVELAFRTSVWSLAGLARMLSELAPPTGGSLVALDFDADDRAWPTYNWMGVCKAGLRSSARYLTRDLGPRGIRVNLVAAGPLRTRAASAIPGFELLTEAWETTAPLGWDPGDADPVADAACFLLSDLARAVSGEVLHVDGGFHAMATALAPSPNRAG
jgi:meromycolic acid enoyl-[acyl-carrier-protein] reductase